MTMKVCLVRNVETKKLLGVYWGDPASIWDAVDECTDPSDYEYANLKHGGLYWGDEEPEALQYGAMDDDSPHFSWDGLQSTEALCDAIHDQSRLRWRRFDYADQGVGLVARIVRQVDAERAERKEAAE
jgi:hypothetical protein